MSIKRRIEALEGAYGKEANRWAPEERARLLEALKARLLSGEEKAAQEEAEGNPARRIALEQLKEKILARRTR